MDGHAGRFVDDHNISILIHDLEGDVLRQNGVDFLQIEINGDQIAGLKAVVGMGKCTVDMDLFLGFESSQQGMGQGQLFFENIPQIDHLIPRIVYVNQPIPIHAQPYSFRYFIQAGAAFDIITVPV
jgi:hypothetical protein